MRRSSSSRTTPPTRRRSAWRARTAPATSRSGSRAGSMSRATRRPARPRASCSASSTTTSRRGRAGWARCSKPRPDTPSTRRSAGRSAPGSRERTCTPAGASRRRSRRSTSGPHDRDAELVWGANLAVRRRALERVGEFDAARSGPGDEEEWERRLRAAGGRILYVAAAGVDHRRAGRDARIAALSRAAWHRGRHSRRFDEGKGTAPGLAGGAANARGLHLAHRALPLRQRDRAERADRRPAARGGRARGLGAGRQRRAARRRGGRSGRRPRLPLRRVRHAGPPRAASPAAYATSPPARACSARRARCGARRATRPPRRRVLVAGVTRPELAAQAGAVARELDRSRHDVARPARARRRGAWQVGEPARGARRAPARGRRLAAARRRRRRAPGAASSTASSTRPSTSACGSPSRRTRSPRTPRGRSRGGSRARSRGGPGSSRSAR